MKCHDKQNGGITYILHPRIAELWRFKERKVEKVHEKDCLFFFKAGLLHSGFLDTAKNGTIFSRN